jgi:hypothetical protein
MARLISRRKFLDRGVQISTAGLLVGVACTAGIGAAGTAAAADKVCADIKSMDGSAQSLRSSLNYAEISKDASKTCSICAFFQGSTDGCGTCQIFSGPANSKGHCDSWGAKS